MHSSNIAVSSEPISEDIEIRHLRQFVVQGLKELLDVRDDWKMLMSLVTIDCDPEQPEKYGQKEIQTIEHAGKRLFPQRGCTEIFLDEWGTSGRRRPKLKDLIMFLEKANLVEAAKYLVVDVLKKTYGENDDDIIVDCKELEKAEPQLAHSFKKQISVFKDTEAVNSYETKTIPSPETLKSTNQRESKKTSIPEDIKSFTLCELEHATNRFNAEPLSKGGNKLGEGQFGSVYYGRLNGMDVAVKTLESNVTLSITRDPELAEIATKLFETEVEVLSQCKHKNLLRLVGFCKDTMDCIVYEYMCNGSLYDRLACLNNTLSLPANTRYIIARGVAEALQYLHSGFGKVVVHRDVKSANVLLDENFVPKLGDFGIVKVSDGSNKNTMYTESTSGTTPYMPPEAHHCVVSTKTDVFSYGIIILELLTGKKPHDDEKHTTLYYSLVAEEETPVREILDRKAGHWDTACVDILVDVVWNKCCLIEKDKRADMKEIVAVLSKMQNA